MPLPIEYEATFLDVDPSDIRRRLKKAKAKLTYPSFLQKRYAFSLPKNKGGQHSWVRVRQEKNKITMSLKVFKGAKKISGQKEICLEINDLLLAKQFLEYLGCKLKAYQENKRELWKLGKVEITIDHWPFLKPLVEIEGPSEPAVKLVAKKLGFDYSQALFCGITKVYSQAYKLPWNVINNHTPKIVFNMPNPFLKK